MMRPSALFALMPVLLIATAAAGQNDDRLQRWLDNCDRSWNSDRAHFCEVRNYTMAPTERISVDGRENGGVTFYGWAKREIKVVARIQTSADDDATANQLAKQIRVLTDGGHIRSEGPAEYRPPHHSSHGYKQTLPQSHAPSRSRVDRLPPSTAQCNCLQLAPLKLKRQAILFQVRRQGRVMT